MPRHIRKSKEEIGLGPDALHFRGIKKMDNPFIWAIDFNSEQLTEVELKSIDEAFRFKNSPTTTWLNIDGVNDKKLMLEIASGFGIDEIILDDVMNTDTRPKMVEHDDSIFISLKMLRLDETGEKVDYDQLSLIITPTILFSFQEEKNNFFEPVRERIRKQRKRIIASGTDYLAFALLDMVIDNYILILSDFGEKIERLEEKSLLVETDHEILELISNYKKELSYLSKNIRPVREMMLVFSKTESELINEGTFINLNELYNNTSHATDLLENYREILTDQLNIYHTTTSHKLNDTMKFLTIFSVIFIPLTFIVGVYGTNFEYLPELHFKNGYFVMWGIMIALTAFMLYFFKKKKWF
jgi:magnesium transporter